MGDENNPQGAVVTQTPDGKSDQTPKETPTFTKEQLEAAVAKARNDTLTDVKRLEAEFKRSQSVAEAALRRLKEAEEASYRQQEDAAKDDPNELSRIRRRRQDVEREAKLAEREATVQTRLTKIVESTAKSLSTRYNVTEEMLKDYSGDDLEKMEKLAISFGERKPTGEPEAPKTTRMKEEPESGKTKGGGATLTRADVAKMSPDERTRRSKEIAALPFE